MVDRAAVQANFGGGMQSSVNQSQGGAAPVDVEKYRTSESVQAPVQSGGTASRMMEMILQTGANLAKQAVGHEREEAYLKGVANAGTVENEQALETNMFTKAWQVAGYRDTMGKVAEADNQAKLAEDMHKMREKSPQEYKQYLAEQRQGLLSAFEGMSAQARGNAFSTMMLQERAAVVRHGAEHYKYIIETESSAVRTSYRSSVAQLNSAKIESPDGSATKVYNAATQSAFGNLNSNIVNNSKLPLNVRADLLKEAASHALESDNQALYKMITDVPVRMADGSMRPMADMLDADSSNALAEKNRTSMERTSAMRNFEMAAEKGMLEAGFKDPNKPLMPFSDVTALAKKYRDAGVIKSDKDVDAFFQAWATQGAQRENKGSLATAWATGNQQQLWALGGTQDAGLIGWREVRGKHLPIPQAIEELHATGETGQMNAYSEIGRILRPGFANLGNSDTIDPAMGASMKQTFDRLKGAKEGAYAQFLTAFTPEEQKKVAYMRDELERGTDPSVATKNVGIKMLEDAKVTPEMRIAMTGNNAKSDAEFVSKLTLEGPVGQALGFVREHLPTWLGGRTPGTGLVRGDVGFTEDPKRAAEVQARTQIELTAALSNIGKLFPNMKDEARQQMAMADVIKRTVGTNTGPFTVPANTTIEKYFGTKHPEFVAGALDEYIAPKPGNRVAYKSSATGSMTFIELDKDNAEVRSGEFDPTKINGVIEKQFKEKQVKFQTARGAGIDHTDKVSGDKVNYNGMNAAGVAPEEMLQLRASLVKHEAVRSKPYPDASSKVVDGKPVITGGVGISSHNPYFPKDVKDGTSTEFTQEQINTSFNRASSAAAKAAMRIVNFKQLKGPEAFQLVGELAYQAGESFDSKRIKGAAQPIYGPFFSAMQDYNAQVAKEEFRKTTAWKMSDPIRRKHYEDLIDKVSTRK